MRLPTGNRLGQSPAPRLVARASSDDSSDAMTPTGIIGICLAIGACVILALCLLVRHIRKKKAANSRSISLGRQNSTASASDDTHVVDIMYGEKVRSSFDASDYDVFKASGGGPKAVSRAAVTNSVILPFPAAARAANKLKAIDVQRANDLSAFPSFSSVDSFYGPAIARAHTGNRLPQSSAIRALAVAAGVATPTEPTSNNQEKGGLELPVELSRFRESTFGNGMKLGEHLGIQTNGSASDRSVSSPAREAPSPARNESAPGSPARPGTAGTFGQPLGAGFSFGGRGHRAHRHAASSLSIADVKSVRISYASGQSSPGPAAGGFPHSPQASVSHGRTESASSMTADVVVRKVQTVFPPLLPDELVLALGEKVTLLQTFDDEWCVVGRDRFGEVEVGAVPVYVFSKAGGQMQRPMRSTSLGIKVEMSSAPGAAWSSREEVMSWSNF